ncbi:MAG: carboxypeptidase regulatory-like domain-containing protein [Nitrospinota bacterium]
MRRMSAVALLISLALFLAPPAGAAYEAIEVKDGGTIAGRVTWSGPFPKVPPFPVVKNPEVCDVGKTGKKPSPRLLVDPQSRGVKNAVVYLANIRRGRKLVRPGAPLVLDQKDCEYNPHVLIAPRRARLAMTTSDVVLHNIHMFGRASYNLPFPRKGIIIKKRLRRAGLIWMRCDAGHAWMSAYIWVVEHPYYALTDAEGRFTLKGVPPGKYVLKAWHEGWKVTKTIEKDGLPAFYEYAAPVEIAKEVTVSPGGTVGVNFKLKEK